MDIDRTKEFEYLVNAYEKSGGSSTELLDKQYGSLVVNGTDVLYKNLIDGIELEILERTEEILKVRLTVKDGFDYPHPVHMCFGMAKKSGLQRIESEYVIGNNARLKVLTHCAFPDPEGVRHEMQGRINIGENSFMEYVEQHYHSDSGEITVAPVSVINVGKGSVYRSDFIMKNGRVGVLDIDYTAFLDEKASVMMNSRIFGKDDDKIKIREAINLNGDHSNALIKSRIAATDNTESEFIGETYGRGAYSRGHIDCTEIVEGNGVVKAVPIVSVSNRTARVTHEAAIGSVDKKQLQTLMSRGVDEDRAIDIIVQGMLA